MNHEVSIESGGVRLTMKCQINHEVSDEPWGAVWSMSSHMNHYASDEPWGARWTEYVIEKPAGEQTVENDVIKSGEKENDDSIEKVKEVSAINPPDLKIAQEVAASNLVSEKSSAEEVKIEKVLDVKFISLIYRCDECSYQTHSEKGLRQHKRKKHKIILAGGADEQIEQLNGDTTLHLDSPTNRSAETKSEKEIEDDLAHLPKLDDPDDVIEKYIKQLDCYKISDMTENQIKRMNALLDRKVAFCDATEKKTSMWYMPY